MEVTKSTSGQPKMSVLFSDSQRWLRWRPRVCWAMPTVCKLLAWNQQGNCSCHPPGDKDNRRNLGAQLTCTSESISPGQPPLWQSNNNPRWDFDSLSTELFRLEKSSKTINSNHSPSLPLTCVPSATCTWLLNPSRDEKGFLVPGLDIPFGTEISPNIQTKPPLVQFKVVSSCPIALYSWEETDPHTLPCHRMREREENL